MGNKAPHTLCRDQETPAGLELFAQTEGWQYDFTNALSNGRLEEALQIATKMNDPVKITQAQAAINTSRAL